jgi:hypothetical protein
MDVGLIAGIVMLVLWAAGTFFFEAPGWMNLLLSVGVFLIIWRIVLRRQETGDRRQGKN